MKASALGLFLILASCRTLASGPAATPAAEVPCRCADGCSADCRVDDGLQTSYRKVVRDPAAQSTRDTEPAAAFTAVDVQAGDPLDQPTLERTAEELSQNAGDLLAGFRGDFVRGRGTEHALLAKSGELTIFKDGAPFASITLGTPLAEDPLQAVKLVDDRLEIVVRHREADRDLLTVCRVIGRAVGRVFEIELDGRVVEFVHLGEERAIRVRGAAEPAVVYRWNPWEGMFRIPAPAPTAPPG